MTDRREITEPEITGNARLALGYIAGLLADLECFYGPVGLERESNSLEIYHRRNGNRYRLTLVQIAGIE